MNDIQNFLPTMEEKTSPENMRMWKYWSHPSAFNDKQAVCYLMALDDKTVGRLVLVRVKGEEKDTAVLYVRSFADGLMHRADEVSSLLAQRLHSRMDALLADLQVEDTDRYKEIRYPYWNWVKNFGMPKTWEDWEGIALDSRSQLDAWDVFPSLEVVKSTDLDKNRNLVGVENGILDYLTGEFKTGSDLKDMTNTHVFNQYPWEFDPEIWETGGVNKDVDHFFPMSFIDLVCPEGLPPWKQKQWRAWRWLASAFHKKLDKQALAMFTKTDAGKSTMMDILDKAFGADVMRMSSAALQPGYGTSPINSEILKMGIARLVTLEELRKCDPETTRNAISSPTVTGRHLYRPYVTLPSRATMVFASNPDPKIDIIGLGNTSDAGDAMANRTVSLPLDQVPKNEQHPYWKHLLDKKFLQVFGHRFLQFVALCAEVGPPKEEDDEELVAEKKRHRNDSKDLWKRDVLPLCYEEAKGEQLTAIELYAAVRILGAEEGIPDNRLPQLRGVTEEFERVTGIQEKDILKDTYREDIRSLVPKTTHTRIKKLTRTRAWKGFKLSASADQELTDGLSQNDREHVSYG